MNPMRWYVDPAWRREGLAHSAFLYPFWGIALTERTPFQRALFERHMFDTSCYQLTEDEREADVVFMPYSHNTALARAPELYALCLEKARSLRKPLVVDGMGDIEHLIDDAEVIVMRYGGYRFLNKGNELFVPPFADDLLEAFCEGVLRVREKSHTPLVGFAGWAQLTSMQTLRATLKGLPSSVRGLIDSRYGAFKKGVLLRAQALDILKRSPLIASNVLVRSGYSGHVLTAEAQAGTLRQQFVENILENDYALDIRGDANASTRLFEILSLGRVPVIVDTQRNFSFLSEVDYREFSLQVDFRDLPKLPERIAQFHQRLSPEDFRRMQQKAREAFVRYFRVDALMEHIVKELRSRIQL